MSANRIWNIVTPENDGLSCEVTQHSSLGEANSYTDRCDNDLPADQQAIANRLLAEAARLETCYPGEVAIPIASSQTASVSRSQKEPAHYKSFWLRVAAAGVLLAIAIGAATWEWRIGPSVQTANTEKPFAFAAVEPRTASQRMQPVDTIPAAISTVQELSFSPLNGTAANRSEVEMLRIQVSAFEQVIRKLQDEISRRDKSAAEMRQLVQSLRDEVKQLSAQIERAKTDPIRPAP